MLLTVSNLHKQFGIEIVLEGVSFQIGRKERVALVGRNGCGKTTLLKILTRDYEADGGSVNWARGATVGYLSQVSMADSDATIYEEAQKAREHLVQMQARLHELEAILEANPTDEDLEEFAMLQDHFIDQGGFNLETSLRVVLQKLGFEEDEWSKPIRALSGGERTRLALAKLLLEEPDLLILDEPTNHLDLQAVEWLESWLQQYHGAVLIVSHDRTFLEATAQRYLEMRDGKVTSYAGPWQKYIELREADEARRADLARKQAEQMAKLDEFVRRFMNSQRTAQARGRLKMLERMEADRIEGPKREKNMQTSLQVKRRAGDLVLKTEKLTFGFDGEPLLRDLDWTVYWGQRWGVIGENGAGKSTLMKVVLGELKAMSGQSKLGASVDLGWFRQDASLLDPEMSPMEFLNSELRMEIGPARNLLGRFLISGDDAGRPIKTLSGGEKGKVALAVLTALQPNVLVLDEPTNHLDMASREALAGVLKEFNGTLILVSHDRWLLEQVTDHTLDLRGKRGHLYGGSYLEYRRSLNKPTQPAPAAASTVIVETPRTALTPREISKEIQRIRKEIAEIESEIESGESSLRDIEATMSAPKSTDDIVRLSHDYAAKKAKLDDAMARWTDLGEQLEEFESLRG